MNFTEIGKYSLIQPMSYPVLFSAVPACLPSSAQALCGLMQPATDVAMVSSLDRECSRIIHSYMRAKLQIKYRNTLYRM